MNEQNFQSDWQPAREDVERLAKAICDYMGYDTELKVIPWEPSRTSYQNLIIVGSVTPVPMWTSFSGVATGALRELYARPIGWKPEQDVTFMDDEPADDNDDMIPGTVDLSGLQQAADTLSREERWFQNSGLR